MTARALNTLIWFMYGDNDIEFISLLVSLSDGELDAVFQVAGR